MKKVDHNEKTSSRYERDVLELLKRRNFKGNFAIN